MTSALNDPCGAIAEPSERHRTVVPVSSIGHPRRQPWADHETKLFAEEASVTETFTDFDPMGTRTNEMVSDTIRVRCLDWALSSPVQDAVRRILGNAAARDARARAEAFANAVRSHAVGVEALADPAPLNHDDETDEPATSPPARAAHVAGTPSTASDDEYDLTPQLVENTAQVDVRFIAQ
jgi:hypothetical protein